jgi:hypothetical protein
MKLGKFFVKNIFKILKLKDSIIKRKFINIIKFSKKDNIFYVGIVYLDNQYVIVSNHRSNWVDYYHILYLFNKHKFSFTHSSIYWRLLHKA